MVENARGSRRHVGKPRQSRTIMRCGWMVDAPMGREAQTETDRFLWGGISPGLTDSPNWPKDGSFKLTVTEIGYFERGVVG